EQFILRVPPSVAERIDFLLSENASSSEDKSLDLSFSVATSAKHDEKRLFHEALSNSEPNATCCRRCGIKDTT
ncbi:unnamed protein product, partial [Ilex paraguariensis]